MGRIARRALTAILCITGLVLGLAACGGSKQASPSLTESGTIDGNQQDPAPLQARELTLAELLTEIEAAERPDGVDRDLFEQLTGELARVLVEKHPAGSKLASTPPTGDENIVDDLYVQEDIYGKSLLSWTYVNLGDYDQNGEANIADVSAIGRHIGKSSAQPGWPMARMADGDGNGEVNISDITPLGVHFLAATAAYNIYGADDPGGPWTLVDSSPLPPPPAGGPLHCEFELASDDYEYYQVRPADSEGTEGSPSLPSTRLGATAQVDLGQDSWIEEVNIGQEGGVVEGGAGTLLEGYRVEFQMGSLDGDTPVRFGVNDGTITPVFGEFDGPIVALETGDQEGFSEPIKLTFPYPRERWSYRPVFFGFDEDGRLHLLTEGNIVGAGAGIMEVVTFNGIKYFGTIFVHPEILDLPLLMSTKYYPAFDGFQEANKGTWLSPGGECFGFSCFSIWYYEQLNFSQGAQRLYNRFMYPVGFGGNTGQDIIASRAHTSVSRMWNTYYSFLVQSQQDDPAALRFLTIASAIGNSGDPVIIYLNHTDNSPGAHAVVGYACDSTGIDIYDPNSPGNVERIPFNGAVLGPYGSYDGIYYCGPGALFYTEAFNNILADAEEGFNANGHGNMWFWSHEPMEEVYSGYVRLQGYVESVDLLVDEMWIGIGNAQTYDYNLFKLPVAANGAMDFTVPIQPGINIFFFDAYGTKIVSPPKGYVPLDLLDCPDPYFRLVGDPTPAVISVVLTWAKDDTDMDLVIVDPTGDYSWPVKPNTADGGELSIDDYDGFGPECWALRTNDTIRWGQPYRIRVHYASDNGHGGQAFSVKVVRHEATANQTTNWYPGFFLESNNWAFDPVNDTGSDWRDVCTVVP